MSSHGLSPVVNRHPCPLVSALRRDRSRHLLSVYYARRKRVKLVGLEGRNCVGRSGIALKADLLLDEVVRQPEQPSALIVPFEMTILQRFARNPWQGQLWQMLHSRCWVTPTESQPLLQTLISSPANTPADYHIHTYQHTSTASAELEELVATLLNELG